MCACVWGRGGLQLARFKRFLRFFFSVETDRHEMRSTFLNCSQCHKKTAFQCSENFRDVFLFSVQNMSRSDALPVVYVYVVNLNCDSEIYCPSMHHYKEKAVVQLPQT